MNEPTGFPMRLNRYLALKQVATRRAADDLIRAGAVFVNGAKAVLGQKVSSDDNVEVRRRGGKTKSYRYVIFHKPLGVVTHSPQYGEKTIADISGFPDLFPVGRLDKDSTGLIILTDDGRITDRLLNPRYDHEKEYRVSVREPVGPHIEAALCTGVEEGGERLTARSAQRIGRHVIDIVLTEGKRHHIRRMLSALHLTVTSLERVRIMNIRLTKEKPGQARMLSGRELALFLESIGIEREKSAPEGGKPINVA